MKQAHIPILKAFDELKFNLGRKTLADFLKGDLNPTIEKNNLDELNAYGCLFMIDKKEIFEIIDILVKNGYLDKKVIRGGYEVVERTIKGFNEIFKKEFVPKDVTVKSLKKHHIFEPTNITSDDRKLFTAFSFFLEKFNDEQKKAIIDQSKSILCVAGAGSGKTTVLTKRIEFLKKFKSIDEKNILAITFTKKAKEEMKHRLERNLIMDVKVETFNSFCEKILKKYGDKIYENETKVASFGDKIKIVKKIVQKKGINFELIIDDYFTKKQIREKTADELFFIFVGDVFTIIDFYKNCEESIKPFYENEINSTLKKIAKIIYEIAIDAQRELKEEGLRDFSDQITDCLELFRKYPNLIPKFEHVLVDEFQDVNLVQVELLKLLNGNNIFAVGDPRQAIYGWRGSEIKFILDFPKTFNNCSVIQLKKNYRSSKKIVDFFNLSITDMGLENLESEVKKEGSISIIEQSSEMLERKFVAESIIKSKVPRNEIFVLGRTNRVLENFADFFTTLGIKYTIKSEEEYKKGKDPSSDEVILATVHSIKGMEAELVFVVSCNNLSFPNKVQDNFVFSLMKDGNDYDKEEEELRLFYVACSRAKTELVISYTGNYSKFITSQMLEFSEFKTKDKKLFDFGSDYEKLDAGSSSVLVNVLKDWRSSKAKESGLPLYMIVSNVAIEEMARRRPTNRLELGQINGLGPVKIAKYGDELLKIIGN